MAASLFQNTLYDDGTLYQDMPIYTNLCKQII